MVGALDVLESSWNYRLTEGCSSVCEQVRVRGGGREKSFGYNISLVTPFMLR